MCVGTPSLHSYRTQHSLAIVDRGRKQNPRAAAGFFDPHQASERYCFILDNKRGDAHPIHLHRYEVTKFGGRRTSGISRTRSPFRDYQKGGIDFVADYSDLTLFHCHQHSIRTSVT
jgi:hypothetical protein